MEQAVFVLQLASRMSSSCDIVENDTKILAVIKVHRERDVENFHQEDIFRRKICERHEREKNVGIFNTLTITLKHESLIDD